MRKFVHLDPTKICLVGLGPAGLGFLWNLVKDERTPQCICIEAGPAVEERLCPVLLSQECVFKLPCHVIGGFGGASLMAGGKLSMYPAGSGLEEIVSSKAHLLEKLQEARKIYSENIVLKEKLLSSSQLSEAQEKFDKLGFTYKHYDSALYTQQEFYDAHVKLQSLYQKSKIPIWFQSKVVDIKKDLSGGYRITFQKEATFYQFTSEKVVLGVGKLGSRFLSTLKTTLNLEGIPNKLEIGLRIEFPIEAFPEIDKYHQDLKLKIKECKTFCISKGGKVALYFNDGLLYTEGYDNYSRQTKFTNLGFLYSLDGKRFDTMSIFSHLVSSRKKNKVTKPIRQSFDDFINYTITKRFEFESSITCWQTGDINNYIPVDIRDSFRNNLSHFVSTFIPEKYRRRISLFFPETNYGGYNYVVNSKFESVPGLYLIGECTGKFIGILQSFATGLICSEELLNDK